MLVVGSVTYATVMDFVINIITTAYVVLAGPALICTAVRIVGPQKAFSINGVEHG